MAEWLVFVEGWQIECCGTPVSVGDVVEWQLRWLDPHPGHKPAVREVADFEPTALTSADTMAFSPGTVLRSGGLSAWWAQTAPPGPLRLRGYLAEDHHGDIPDEVPATTGTVRGIEIVTARFAPDIPGDDTWRPVPGTARLTAVTTSPKWFSEDPPWHDTGAPESRAVQTGVLVRLEVADRRG